ncbi:1-phosphatidylinositol 4,5-bisphosphate phosphodiesterase delta-3 isoform X5 [Carettochelys insculpta]|uniref:1-phosphatidylinositol 4,5-bisphosphate phosphodiesterase delta-3 isoform X5 n=1 Tax=Carettochelys insculpta TaxID=44489 RepID=UPI003EB851E6
MICGRRQKTRPEQDSGARRPGRALRKMGLTEDEDIKAMLKGSLLWKIKSRRWQKQRLYRLQEDGLTIWFESRFKRPRSKQIFSIAHLEAVREGYQSEGLRKYGRAFPERQCLTLVFRGRRKNLDLVAPSEEEAQRWVRGLSKLMAKVEAMSQQEKLDHWIHAILRRADRDQDNTMSFAEVKDVLRMINIGMNDIYAYQLFKECDKSSNDRLEEQEVEEFCTRLMQRPELEEIFHRYSGQDRVLCAQELAHFLRDQGEEASLARARRIVRTYELSERAKQHDLMMLDGFMMYLLSPHGDILSQEHAQVCQDMTQPLCHYFVSTSHNTYLTHNQIGGASSSEAYVRALAEGCRCVELDCWEGPNGEPVIYHGHTLTSKILFRDVIESIRDFAFKSPRLLQEVRPLQAKDAAQPSRELSDLVLYCQAVRFCSLEQALCGQQPCLMYSFSERKARKLIRESGNGLVRYNARQLSRIYPLGLKMNSANYNPQEMWNAGCQLVALNFQTPGWEMDLNRGRFLANGRCGYVLKPSFLRSRQSTFHPEHGHGPGHRATLLQVKVITAQQLPKLSGKKSSIVDPLVRVEIHGVPGDCSKQQTDYKLNNGFNPRWEETLSFQLRVPELALVRFVVEDYDTTSCNDFVGQFTLPFTSLREGYRHIHLLSKDGASLAPATLFVHVRAKQL